MRLIAILTCFLSVLLMPSGFGQDYTMTVEEHAVDGIPGLTTYRFYMDLVNADDYVSSAFGNENHPLLISTANGFYNDQFATGGSADGINPLVFGIVPTLAFDSWFTLGIESAPAAGYSSISAVESNLQPWINCFTAGSSIDGQDVDISNEIGGAWYIVPGPLNGLPDANMRVLLAQITSDSPPSGTINVQIFPNGDGDRRFGFNYSGAGVYSGFCIETADFPCDEVSVPGCTNVTACNYDAAATIEDDSCVFADGNCEVCNEEGGVSIQDADGDGVCDADEVVGCQDDTACNFNEAATDAGDCVFADGNCEICNAEGGVSVLDADGDGVCDADEIAGCQDDAACNFNEGATDAGDCVFADGNCEICNAQGGVTIEDADSDGICDDDEVVGCQDDAACNFNEAATDAGDCVFADGSCEICNAEGGVSVLDADGDGVCDADEIAGCQDDAACNFNEAATDAGDCVFADGSCEICNAEGGVSVLDADGDGVCDADEVAGCQDNTACNFNEGATDAGDCVFADGNCEICNAQGGVTIEDADSDGICDDDEVVGCQDDAACNFNEAATDAGDCVFADGNCEICNAEGGVSVLDADGDGVCDADEIAGCQDDAACNFNEAATDAGDCVFADESCEICNAEGGVSVLDADGDGVCDADEVAGCQDNTACNFNEAATDAGDCVFADGSCEICNAEGGVSVLDADGDGVCDADEIAGCQDDAACNFNEAATDAGDCVFADGSCEICNAEGGVTVLDADGDGVCDADEIAGCQDDAACNFNEAATDAGDCVFADGSCEICNAEGGVSVLDADGDGVCDDDEVVGCQDDAACNFNEAATDAGDCVFADGSCEICNAEGGVSVLDADGDGVCDDDEVVGCQDDAACNFNEAATDAGDCVFADGSCEICNAEGGVTVLDADGDGVCDADEVSGCTDISACNFGDFSDSDNSLCAYADGNCEVCNTEGGVSIQDADGDGVCDADEVAGCQDNTACNFNESATDAGDCVFADGSCEICNAQGGVTIEDADSDGICDDDEVVGCQDDAACNFNEAATDEGNCVFADGNCETCNAEGGVSVLDADGDGVCDADEIAGCQDDAACNFNEAATDAGDCVFADGSCEICNAQGGVSVLDADGDGVCDADEVSGCTDISACNFGDFSDSDNSLCAYADGNCEVCNTEGGVSIQDADGDGVCDADEVAGCQDNTACNFNESATDAGDCVFADGSCEICNAQGGVTIEDADSDGICDDDEVVGCQDDAACNFNEAATDEGNCVFADGNCEVCNTEGGVSIQDADGDGVCDADEIAGCQDDAACNFNEAATDAGDCVFADGSCEICNAQGGVSVLDADGDGVCDDDEVVGCQDDAACNFNEAATDEGNCVFADGNCEVCNTEGGVSIQDADGDGICDADEIADCQDDTACNYDPNATDAGYCHFPEPGYDCDGNCISDADEDGVCDAFEIDGCTDSNSCNYNNQATDDNGSCSFADAGYDCDGNCLIDTDGDGICQQDEVVGCQESTACNYDPNATDAGYCHFPEPGYDCNGNCISDADQDGICDAFEIDGCTDSNACNYNNQATDDNGSCSFADAGYDCDGNCLIDTDGDGVCQQDEVVGCQESTACNYDPNATDAGYCHFPEPGYDCNGNCISDADQDGICDAFEIDGCTDSNACNYNNQATDDNGSCSFADAGYDCDGNCLIDTDGDGVCQQDEVVGCQDIQACNFNANATDSGACIYPGEDEDCDGVCINDADGDGICDEQEIAGCDDIEAINFHPAVTDAENATCVYEEDFALTCYDFSGDDFVGTADLLLFLQQIGTSCED